MERKQLLENEMERMDKIQNILLSSIHNNGMAKDPNGLSILYTSIKEFRDNFMVILQIDPFIPEFIEEEQVTFTPKNE